MHIRGIPSEAHHPWSEAGLVGDIVEGLLLDGSVLVDSLRPPRFLFVAAQRVRSGREAWERIKSCTYMHRSNGGSPRRLHNNVEVVVYSVHINGNLTNEFITPESRGLQVVAGASSVFLFF